MNKNLKILSICGIIAILIVGIGFGLYQYNRSQAYNGLISSANKYMDNGDYDQAIALFEQSLNYKKDDNIERSIKLAKDLKDIKVLYDNGISLMNDKEYSKAIDAFNKVTNEDNGLYSKSQEKISECKKKLIVQDIQLANNSAKNNNYDDANKYLDEILKVDSSNAEAKKLKTSFAKAVTAKQESKKSETTAKQQTAQQGITQQQAMNLVSSKVQLGSNETLDFPYDKSQATRNYNGATCYVIGQNCGQGENEDEICEYLVNINTGAITKNDQGIYTPIN